MAVFGRRQPHAPVILHGLLPPQKPIGRVQIFGQKTAQHSANRFFYRSFPAIIRRSGGQPSIARLLIVHRQAQIASRRPFRRGVFVSIAPPPPVISTAPIGKSLLFGQKTSQAATDRYFRRRLTPIVNRAGGRPAVAMTSLSLTAMRTAADRYYRRSLTPIIIRRAGPPPSVARLLIIQRLAQAATQRPVRRPVWISPRPPAPIVVTAPIGKVLIFGQRMAQHAADRYFRRAFPATIKRSGGTRPIARTVLIGQKTGQLAADRYFRRSFPAIIKRAGGQPSTGRLVIYIKVAQVAARRPGSRIVSLESAAPPPTPPPPSALFGGRWTPPRLSLRWTPERLSLRWTPSRGESMAAEPTTMVHGSTRIMQMNFGLQPELIGGLTINSCTVSQTVLNSGTGSIVIGTISILGPIVYVFLSGGNANNTYLVTFTATLSNNNPLVLEGVCNVVSQNPNA